MIRNKMGCWIKWVVGGDIGVKWGVENELLGYNDIVEFDLKPLAEIFLLETSYFLQIIFLPFWEVLIRKGSPNFDLFYRCWIWGVALKTFGGNLL